MRPGEGLAVEEDGQQEVAGRRDVLEEADRGVFETAGRRGEPDQRQGGDRAGQKQQDVRAEAQRAEGAAAGQRQIAQIGQSQGQQQRGLDEEAVDRLDPDRLADQAVEPEGQRQGQRHPGQAVGPERQVEHAEGREPDGEAAPGADALAQHQHAQDHVDQGIDVVAQAGLEHAPGGDRPDEDQPVDRDDQRGEHEQQARAPIGQRPCDHRPVARQGDQPGEQDHRPDDPVRQHLEQRHVADRLEVDRDAAPEQESGQRVGHAGRRLAAPGRAARRPAHHTASTTKKPVARLHRAAMPA